MDESASAALRGQIWAGHVPAVFTMAPSEVTTPSPPPPAYLLLPRHGYLPLATADVVEGLRTHAPPMIGAQEVWFEHAGVPLKWNLPIGVLYDLAGGDSELPWQIVVHFTGFGSQQLLQCEGPEAVEASFMHALKQALFLRFGSPTIVMGLPKEKSAQLWEGVRTANASLYWSANARLVDHDTPVRHVPVRVLQAGKPVVQLPVPRSSSQTLRTALELLLPSFPSSSSLAPLPAVVVQGVEPQLDSPLEELWSVMAHPDHWLYVVVSAPQQ